MVRAKTLTYPKVLWAVIFLSSLALCLNLISFYSLLWRLDSARVQLKNLLIEKSVLQQRVNLSRSQSTTDKIAESLGLKRSQTAEFIRETAQAFSSR